jgi:hypothetical protein
MYSMHTAKLDVPHLPPSACHCHIVPGLRAFSLISTTQLYNANCDVLFQTDTVGIGFRNTVCMQRTWVHDTGLWHLDLRHHDAPHWVLPAMLTLLLLSGKPVQEVISSIPCNCSCPDPALTPLQEMSNCLMGIRSATPAALVAFSYATVFSLALSTLATALTKGFLPQLQCFAVKTLRRYPPQSVVIIRGHVSLACP